VTPRHGRERRQCSYEYEFETTNKHIARLELLPLNQSHRKEVYRSHEQRIDKEKYSYCGIIAGPICLSDDGKNRDSQINVVSNLEHHRRGLFRL